MELNDTYLPFSRQLMIALFVSMLILVGIWLFLLRSNLLVITMTVDVMNVEW